MSEVEVQIVPEESLRERCNECSTKFIKGSLKIVMIDFSTHDAWIVGGQQYCYHLECFIKIRLTLNPRLIGNEIRYAREVPKKLKEQLQNDVLDKEFQRAASDCVASQNKRLFTRKESIKGWSRSVLHKLLEHNHQYVPSCKNEILKILCDTMEFGALEECPDCGGQLKFVTNDGYTCTNVLQWSDCFFSTGSPKRREFLIPKDLKTNMPEVFDYVCKLGNRILTENKAHFLQDFSFIILGKNEIIKSRLQKKILSLGGSVRSRLTANITSLVSSKELLEEMVPEIQKAKNWGIAVLSDNFLDNIDSWDKDAVELVVEKTISDWKCTKIDDLSAKLSDVQIGHVSPVKPAQLNQFTVKGGGDVPQQFVKNWHVYKRITEKYTVTLGLTDICKKKSTYHKLQILKNDTIDQYIFYQSYGQIGDQNPREIEDFFDTADSCIEAFESKFEAKTGNKWNNRENFVKFPRLMQILNTEFFGLDNHLVDAEVESKLEVEVQNLIKEILDLETLKKRVWSLKIDINKLPLGVISDSQLAKAKSILGKLFHILRSKQSHNDLIQANNEFYTLVPHAGHTDLLDTEIAVTKKYKLLDNLMKIAKAFQLHSNKLSWNPKNNTLDEQYRQLNAEITVLNKNSSMFDVIKSYVDNTHGPTHKDYQLEVVQVFQVNRGEDLTRFKIYQSKPNRKLLWHGTRTVNFASIIKDGLQIAPPNVQHSGYMFGKGIYFADVVTKSANYCHSEETNRMGLLLLSEVALGNSWKLRNACNIENLSPPWNSVLGEGLFVPDPMGEVFIEEGVGVPCGKPIDVKEPRTLWYNEYIVYSLDQVRIRYIVKVRFNPMLNASLA